MTESGESLPPIPNNAIRRLEKALLEQENGAEAALLTQIYNFFEVSPDDACPHRLPDEEVDRGSLFVVRRSTLVDERVGETFTLTYERMYETDTDDNEVLVRSQQKVCFKRSDGEIEELLAELPNSVPRGEIEVFEIESGEVPDDDADFSSTHFVALLDEFTRLHIDER